MTDVKASIYDLLTSKFGVPAVQLDDNATLESSTWTHCYSWSSA